MKINQKTKMILTGLLGFAFFLIANLTKFFVGMNLIAAIIQLVINTIVFYVWLEGYKKNNRLA